MAATADCFHDDCDDDDRAIADLEWNKLKSLHIKEGYRDGYSSGQEDALQQAFNQGFAHQVKLDTHAAFFKGILVALKSSSEKSSKSDQQTPKISLTIDDISRIESLLSDLDCMAGEDGWTKGIAPEAAHEDEASKIDQEEKSTDKLEETDISKREELYINQTSYNSASDIIEGETCDRSGDSKYAEYEGLQRDLKSVHEKSVLPKVDSEWTKCESHKKDRCKLTCSCGSAEQDLVTVDREVDACEGACSCKSTHSEERHRNAGDRSSSVPSATQCSSLYSMEERREDQTFHGNPSGGTEYPAEATDDQSSCSMPNCCKQREIAEEAVTKFRDHHSKMKDITANCRHIMKELGIENVLLLNQFTQDI